MSSPVGKGFRGLQWEPSNEQEVVMLFGRLLDHLPRPLAIEFVQTGFPDCKAIDVDTAEVVWIEFELYSSHYRRDHRARPERCDWIVCWSKDEREAPDAPTVVPLDHIVDGQPDPGTYILNRRPPGATQEEYFQLRVRALSQHHQHVIRRIAESARAAGLQMAWPDTNGACFTVRDTIEYFKVDSSGRIGTPFSRWRDTEVPGHVKAALVAELNEAFKGNWFSDRGKIGVDIEQLLPDEAAVQRYMNAWQRFVEARRG